MPGPRVAAFNLPLAATVVSWGFNFVALKILLAHVTPAALVLTRSLAMYLCLLAICRVRSVPLKVGRGDGLRIGFLGFLMMGLYLVVFFEGLKLTTVAEGSITLATATIFTGLFAAFAGQERLTLRWLLGAGVAFGGVAIVQLAGAQAGHGRLIGNLLVLGSAALWALSTVAARSLLKRYDPVQLLTLAMPGAFVAAIPYGLAPALAVNWAQLSLTDWLLFIYVAAGAGALGFVGFSAGVQALGAGRAMLYQYFVPPLAVVFGWLCIGSTMTLTQGLGMALTLAGVALAMGRRDAAQGIGEPPSKVNSGSFEEDRARLAQARTETTG